MAGVTVKALLITDLDGKRLFSKFYDKEILKPKQTDIELHVAKSTTSKGNSELFLLDKYLVIYKIVSDLIISIITDATENELFVNNALSCIVDTFGIVFSSKGFDKKTALEYFDKVAITVDEVIDDGFILDTDPETVANRVNLKGLEGNESINLSDATITDALHFAKGSLINLWRGK
ncbi:coatomer subunit zeta-1, putative [Entamoeba invadens IP1]|uniref:Coatomer subunit zeta-1, putative n=1 Tax=Entamoeba invadens IP1 TaxID=370355 RepID=A0A0A1UCP3_ENTIV|nr:coatomer subunit zeta-1, putative [Entamoeba invadens IP1]ELP90064.1 coatomer subunit zeta-1, putative [Entamoeba invadens IP1]|eukprot:XP_004256835.1 coatomer subunit zeta-1, putative [Entamoeba invadens IP1]